MPNLNPFAVARRFKPDKERRFQRHEIDLALSIKLWRSGAFHTLEGCGNNVSQGGMAFTLALSLQVGETVSLEVVLPFSEHPLTLTGVVRHCQGTKYGVEFIGLREQQRRAIVRFCERLERAQ
jgi:c-di-GMP-binding flagellar brake protein YcgR